MRTPRPSKVGEPLNKEKLYVACKAIVIMNNLMGII
jgi:hypothetical protein